MEFADGLCAGCYETAYIARCSHVPAFLANPVREALPKHSYGSSVRTFTAASRKATERDFSLGE